MRSPFGTTHFVIPERNRSGGIRVTVEMANHLLDRGLTVRLVVLPPTNLRDRIRCLRRAAMPHGDWVRGFRGQVVMASGGLRALRFGPEDVVVAVGSYVVPAVRSLDHGPVLIRYCHGLHLFDEQRMIAAWTGEMPTLTVAEPTAAVLRERFGTHVHAVVPNGIDLEKYYPAPVERRRVGTIYSNHEAKAPEDIIEFFRRWSAACPGVETCAFSMSAKPRELRVSVFKRRPSLAVARELYSSAIVWIVLSRAEGLPGQVLEAMACGAAVVATDEPGSAAIIRGGHNGILVPVGNAGAAIEGVRHLLHDEDARTRLVCNAQKTVRDYSWDRAADVFVSAVSKIVELQRGRRPP